MKILDERHFLYIEPQHDASAPVLDDITRKATALQRACTPSAYRFRGQHNCTGCERALSDNADHTTPDGRVTHSLVVHYVARHRTECPAADLEFIASLTDEAEPTAEEIS